MDVKEFKELKPELAHLEGNELWDAMGDYMLRCQQGDEMIKDAMPFFKKYRLRWLFYRKVRNFYIPTESWEAHNRCSKCKKGVNGRMCILDFKNKTSTSYCPHCGGEYIAEANTNIDYRLHKLWGGICGRFWWVLDEMHLVRSNISGRYDMFGDERRYVESWTLKHKDGSIEYRLNKRRWFEYIFIRK